MGFAIANIPQQSRWFGQPAFTPPIILPRPDTSRLLKPKPRLQQEHTFVNSVRGSICLAAFLFSPKVRSKIEDLLNLKAGWDGPRTEAVKLPSLADAIDLMTRIKLGSDKFIEPFISPLYDGNVQLDWRSQSHSLEFQTTDPGWLVTGEYDGHVEQAECSRFDIAKIEGLYRWFSGSELIWPSW